MNRRSDFIVFATIIIIGRRWTNISGRALHFSCAPSIPNMTGFILTFLFKFPVLLLDFFLFSYKSRVYIEWRIVEKRISFKRVRENNIRVFVSY